MADTRIDVIGIGSTVYDMLMVVNRFPQEDTKQRGLETRIQGGGPCATALVAASRLGLTTAYMGTVGDDSFGQYMLDDLNRWGVDTSHVRVEHGAVSYHSAVLLNQETGTRTCVWNPGTVHPPEPEQLDERALRACRALHLDGHMLDAAIHAAEICHEAGIPVCLDAGGVYPGIERLLPLVSLLIPSEEFALRFTGEATAENAALCLMQRYHPQVIVITQGSRGGLILDEHGLRRYASFPVRVLDSNGCGDTFHGAFLAGFLGGMQADDACAYASAAAAIKCTRLGARQGMPCDRECRAFLAERGLLLNPASSSRKSSMEDEAEGARR